MPAPPHCNGSPGPNPVAPRSSGPEAGHAFGHPQTKIRPIGHPQEDPVSRKARKRQAERERARQSAKPKGQTSDTRREVTHELWRHCGGYLPITDLQPHYLRDLGLRDVNRGPR